MPPGPWSIPAYEDINISHYEKAGNAAMLGLTQLIWPFQSGFLSDAELTSELELGLESLQPDIARPPGSVNQRRGTLSRCPKRNTGRTHQGWTYFQHEKS